MLFATLDIHLRNCKTHLDTTSAHNTEIESYLVQYLLTRIVAEYEARIAILVQRRCSRMRDSHVKQFIQHSAKDVSKRFAISDLGGMLRRFGEDYKKSFHVSVVDKPPHVAWDNIYNNRQAVAHGGSVQMSFGDLAKNYTESLVVLDELVAALCLKPREIRDLK